MSAYKREKKPIFLIQSTKAHKMKYNRKGERWKSIREPERKNEERKREKMLKRNPGGLACLF